MSHSGAMLSSQLLTNWSELEPAFRLLSRWDCQGGIVFVSTDDDGLLTARQVAEALGGRTVEFPETRIGKVDYEAQVGKYLDHRKWDTATLFDEPVDRLCVIVPRIDKQADWLPFKIKYHCEHAPRAFVILLTCADLEWKPDFLAGHLYECFKQPSQPA